jgi:haloacetate dehalogenase
MFEGFEQLQIQTSGTTINLVKGGDGPPLLLLHGYPQTHTMWHKVAPLLARDFTVVAADLRGYGDSGKPKGGSEHLNYSKRAMAQDQVEVMEQLGFDSFLLAAHDRGARVSHRLTKDHPQRVRKLALLDIIPTGYVGRTQDVLQVWRDYATDVRGHSMPCGHHIAEEMPEEAHAAIRDFFLTD